MLMMQHFMQQIVTVIDKVAGDQAANGDQKEYEFQTDDKVNTRAHLCTT